jgi:hypothetical protein
MFTTASSLLRRERCEDSSAAELALAMGGDEAREAATAEVRQQVVDAIYAGQSFRSALCDLNLTLTRFCSMARVDREWSAGWRAVLMTTRRDDLKHGTNAACVAGCVQRMPQ